MDSKEIERLADQMAATTPARILVCGSREWTNKRAIYDVLMAYLPATVIHGGARGADRLAGEVARYIGCNVVEYCADWLTHGKAAGPIRNQKMLEATPDLVIAFHEKLSESKGTKDMVERAKKVGVPVLLIQSHYGEPIYIDDKGLHPGWVFEWPTITEEDEDELA